MDMPMSPLVSAIVSSIVSAIIESPTTTTEPVAVQSSAAARNFPSVSIPGRLESLSAMGHVVISGKTLPAAPGLQIRDEQNRIVLSSTLTRFDLPVLYQMDSTGLNVWRIWLLTPTEVAVLGRNNFYARPVTLPGSILSQ
jgi:hypothetical protein